jgi:hypothetical protein
MIGANRPIEGALNGSERKKKRSAATWICVHWSFERSRVQTVCEMFPKIGAVGKAKAKAKSTIVYAKNAGPGPPRKAADCGFILA